MNACAPWDRRMLAKNVFCDEYVSGSHDDDGKDGDDDDDDDEDDVLIRSSRHLSDRP